MLVGAILATAASRVHKHIVLKGGFKSRRTIVLNELWSNARHIAFNIVRVHCPASPAATLSHHHYCCRFLLADPPDKLLEPLE